MAETDDANVESKFKKWIHEVMDERETKAAADSAKAEEERKKAEKENQRPGIMSTLFGG